MQPELPKRVYFASKGDEGWYIEDEVGVPLEGPYHDEQYAKDKAAAYNLGRKSREEKGQV